MTAQQLFSTYSIDQIRSAFIQYISSQRNVDKYGLSYFLHMIDSKRYFSTHLYPEDFKRAQILQWLINEVQEEKNLRICICSDYTTAKVLYLVEDAMIA